MSIGFTEAERNAIEAAFNNWQAANGQTGNASGVTFSFTISLVPVSGANTFQINKETPPTAPGASGPPQAVKDFS